VRERNGCLVRFGFSWAADHGYSAAGMMDPTEKSLVGGVLDGVYRIERLVGEGGMGAVYEATHLRLEKRVAVKVMAHALTANAEALERFRREARVTSALGHPHIVQVLDFSALPTGEPFLVMEYLVGEDLDHRLRQVRRLSVEAVVSITNQVASALAATHAEGVVHRDLKPGNIYLLDAAGAIDFVKVLDFGISKVRSATTQLTRASAVMGTPNYMSPEQARGDIDDIDERTDQWALACIAWECLSGECPFVGESSPSILYRIVHEPPPSLLPKVADLVPEVEDVLVRALSKDKAERFASVSDFAVALESAMRGTAVAAPRARPVPRTVHLETSTPAGPPTARTTFTQTAGELGQVEGPRATGKRARWLWGVTTGAAGIVLAVVLALLRPGSATRPAVDKTVEAPRTPAVAPSPEPEPPVAPTNSPSEPAPALAQPMPAATTVPRDSKESPRAHGTDDGSRKAQKPARSPEARSRRPIAPSHKEAQDRWRLD
jgi:eukaryotic-like serine/threonine-protein kinase